MRRNADKVQKYFAGFVESCRRPVGKKQQQGLGPFELESGQGDKKRLQKQQKKLYFCRVSEPLGFFYATERSEWNDRRRSSEV